MKKKRRYRISQDRAGKYSTTQKKSTQHCKVQHNTTKYSIAQQHRAKDNTEKDNIAKYSTTQHYQSSTTDHHQSATNHQPLTVNHQQSTINHQPSVQTLTDVLLAPPPTNGYSISVSVVNLPPYIEREPLRLVWTINKRGCVLRLLTLA